MTLFLASTIHAQARSSFDLPAQSLATSLRAVASQTGTNVLFDPPLVEGRVAPALKAQLTLDQAFTKLLAGTGLKYRFLDDKTVMVISASESQSAAAGHTSANTDTPVVGGQPLLMAQTNPTASSTNNSATTENQSVPNKESKSSSSPEVGRSGLEEIVVTGTHIRGAATSSPLVVISREDIDRSGYTAVGDVLRSLPQNFSGGNSPQVATGSAPGADNVLSLGAGYAPNLRGLGSASTLTLVNGRRFAQSTITGATDISGIPLDVVDHIDVVTDGASATYGSDAVAGVVNLVLKSNYDGARTSASFGRATEGGALDKRASQLFGKTWNGGDVILDYEHDDQEAVFSSQRDFTATVLRPYTLLPAEKRDSLFLSGRQDLSASIAVFVEGAYANIRPHYVDTYAPTVVYDYPSTVEEHAVTAGVNASLLGNWHATAYFSTSEQRTESNVYPIEPDNTKGSLLSQEVLLGKTHTVELDADGPIFQLPTGVTRLAVGAGERHDDFSDVLTLFNLTESHGGRDIRYAFGELAIPLISEGTVPGLKKLDFTASGRYEHYSDFGSKSVPKIGFNYVPLDHLTVRGSWGKSFRAPPLESLQRLREISLQQIPDPLSASGGSPVLDVAGGNPSLQPETARNWTIGIDYRPTWVSGLQISSDYFSIVYSNRIGRLTNLFAALTDPTNSPFVTRNPSAPTQLALLNDIGALYNRTGTPYDPATVAAIVNAAQINVARQDINGVDLQLLYLLDPHLGRISLFLNGTYLELRQRVTDTALQQELAGTTFNPPRYRARGGGTWMIGTVSATVIANYLGTEVNTNQPGNPPVGSWTTFDTQVVYNAPKDSVFRGTRISLSVQNIFDRSPPFIKFDAFRQGFNYDVTNVSPIGRFVSLQLVKEW